MITHLVGFDSIAQWVDSLTKQCGWTQRREQPELGRHRVREDLLPLGVAIDAQRAFHHEKLGGLEQTEVGVRVAIQ